ncbi:MAG: hypothetical protein A3F72_14005 [Bacteroidetes bacterium RIFCSPLOWO2_12_FULL_35_15]|nr:MAG: hypothetical protein A3F72_14005 [Bacteroidetes bacterium RIFCSPLOWO2_12_FULL_35_15]
MKAVNIFLFLTVSFFSCDKKPKEKPNEIGTQENNTIIELSAREQGLVNLNIETVRNKTIFETTTLLGKATVDENKISIISSRIKGRVESLFVRTTGEEIKNGEALYSIYSEELLTDQNEYLLAIKQRPEFSSEKNMVNKLTEASKKKLLLWGMGENQINKLEQSKSPSPSITFYSDVSGYLAELNISEGEYVDIGTALLKIAQASSVWVEAQAFPNEINYLYQNPETNIEFEALPNEVFKGRIVFNSPAFEQNSKINFVRIEIQNINRTIKPGMMASVVLKTDAKKTVVIPKSSITLGEMPTVWIEKEKGKYEMRRIHTGIQTKNEIEVIHGIAEGEKIVTSGTYLINSAYILTNGANSMEGMKM